MAHAIPYGGCVLCTQILQPLMTLPCTLRGLCPNASQLPRCLGGPAGSGAWCSNLSSSQCQGKVPGRTSRTLSYCPVPRQCWAKLPGRSQCPGMHWPCWCWSQFQLPAGAAGVRVAPVPHSSSLPKPVPAPVPSDGPIFWMIPGLGVWAMLDLDPRSPDWSPAPGPAPAGAVPISHYRVVPVPTPSSDHSSQQWGLSVSGAGCHS